MRIAICEDDKQICEQLYGLLTMQKNSTHQIKMYHSGDSFWFDYQGYQQPFDLIIMDIEMPGELNGISVAKKIRAKGDNVPIVILTAFIKYALDGYEVRPFHYLVKPIQKQKMFEIIEEIENRLNTYWNDCLNLSVQGGFLRIPFDDIVYLESRAHNVFIHTRQDKYKLYRKLDDVLDLCDERFLYAHKSYAVNADMIREISGRYTTIFLEDGNKIPISQQKKGDFIKSLMKYDRNYGTIRA